MYIDKTKTHRNRLREILADIAENIHKIDASLGKMANLLDDVDVYQEDLSDHIVDLHARLSAAHTRLDDFDEYVYELPWKE